MDFAKLAHVGDSIECNVRNPLPGTIRVQLLTSDACAYANALLLNPASGWRLVTGGAE